MIALANASVEARARETVLKRELSAAGVKWSALQEVLPDWAANAKTSKAGMLELKGFVVRHLGLEFDGDGKLQPQPLPEARFKTSQGTAPDMVASARVAATAAARLVAQAVEQPWTPLERDPVELRKRLLSRSRRGWIDFETLLAAAWEAGVPVVYLPRLPTAGKKMEGMVTFLAGRPVIVLSKKNDHPDWMLFILAHEIAHIALGHLPSEDGQAIVDDTVEESTAGVDLQEREANAYALRVLTPDGEPIRIIGPVQPAPQLARAAIALGKEHGISPGHVILNAAANNKIGGNSLFALGNAALKHLPSDVVSGVTPDLCRDEAQRYINPQELSHDSVEFLEKINVI